MEVLKDERHSKGSTLPYAWDKVRELDCLILFDLGSTHNLIFIEVDTTMGIHDFEMGDTIQANGAFKGQEVLITSLIGKLQLHI